MIPNWQIAGLLILALVSIGMGIYSAPQSYAHLYLTGQCKHEPMPYACHPRRVGTVSSGVQP
jgi:hypothetical protein